MAPVNKPKHPGKAVLAGGISGAVEICCTYPIEFTKTVQQLSTSKPTVAEVVKDTLRTRGPFGLYKGLDSMVYFATPKAAIRFSGFEAASGAMRGADGTPMFGAATAFAAGLVAGAIEAVCVSTPQETIKIRLIDDQFKVDGTAPRFNGFFHGVKTIVAEEGFGGIYHGLSPTILKVATAQATRFGVFNCIPAEYRKTPAGSAASGAFAGGVSVLAFQGIDVIKSRMQGLDAHKYASSLDCLRTLVREEGVMALYKGIGPRMTRVCCEVAITMTLYGEVVKLLDSVWDTTGADTTKKEGEASSSSSVPRQPPGGAQGGGGKLQPNLIRTGSTLIEVPTGAYGAGGGGGGAGGNGGGGAGGPSKLKATPSGSMAAFTQEGADPVAGKGAGTPM